MIDLRLGNVLDVLAQMPSESVHTICTSPPYWGLRSYGTTPQIWRNGSEPCPDGHTWGDGLGERKQTAQERLGNAIDPRSGNPAGGTRHGLEFTASQGNTCTRCGAWRGELGLEPTPELFVEHIVAVMREARRVLRADGTCWINLGDSYANTKVGNTNEAPDKKPRASLDAWHEMKFKKELPPGLKPKDLVGIPWRVAFALQADGWTLRSDIIWHKPNPMPESVRDRPTKSHEYLFLLSKQPRYYYDADAVREPHVTASQSETRKATKWGKKKLLTNKPNALSYANAENHCYHEGGRNRRSVWTVTTVPFKQSHFATFPPKLIEPCILAATSERGVCSKCGAPWVRERKPTEEYAKRLEHANDRGDWYARQGTTEARDDGTKHGKLEGNIHAEYMTIGWRASCACDAGEPVPATVLDPFNGAGTTGLVALQHGRNYIGIDLKEDYLKMTRARLDKAQIAMVTM